MPVPRPISFHARPHEEGSSLIITVLFVTLLISALLAATTQLSLSSRTGSAERRDTLKAQYAAESGLNVAFAHIQAIQQLFEGSTTESGTTTYINVPKTTRAADVLLLAQQYCGNVSWNQTSPAGTYPVQSYCTANTSTADTRYQVLWQYVDPNVLPSMFAQQLGKTTLTATDLKMYWQKAFGTGITVQRDEANEGYTVTYKLKPLRVERTGMTRYRFYLQLDGLSAQGTSGSAERVVQALPTARSEFWFEIVLPTFVDRVLFTNYHRTKSGARPNFTTQSFDGPVHTNDYFIFANGGTPEFTGAVTSAGCYEFASNGTCNKNTNGTDKTQAGLLLSTTGTDYYYTLGAAKKSISEYSNSNQSTLNAITSKITAPSTTKATFSVAPKWNADFQPMPENAEDQKAAANDAGLVLPSGATVTLAASTDGNTVVSPTTFDVSTQRWTPNATYQFITVVSGITTTVYRVGPSGALEKKTGSNWSIERTAFNGVLYSSGKVNIGGPGRSGAQPLPALSAASQLTLAADDGVVVQNDITYSDVPCKPPAACASKATPMNLLGIYSQDGDVIISKNAPNDLNVHGVLMSSTGEVTVENYSTGSPRGDIKLLGGLIENYYGAFGTFDPRNPSKLGTGYGRDFSFDIRMSEGYGMTPPYFPVSPKWAVKSAENEGRSLSNLNWQQGTK